MDMSPDIFEENGHFDQNVAPAQQQNYISGLIGHFWSRWIMISLLYVDGVIDISTTALLKHCQLANEMVIHVN